MAALASILNNFDRPRGATQDAPGASGEGVKFGSGPASLAWSTEYTTHTMMCDIARARFYIRRHAGLNWSIADLAGLTGLKSVTFFPTLDLDVLGEDLTAALLKAGS